MLIRTHLHAQDASWSEALLGAPRRPVEEPPDSAAPAPDRPRVAPAAATAGEEPPADKREAEAATRNRLETAREPQDLALIRKLKARDREVRAHEQAHASVGGQYAGAATFSYQRGPDGVLYAVGGEVSIDIGPVPGNAQATLDKALQVQRAALAPSDPSSTDRRVALRAQGLARDARAQLAELAALERATAPSTEQQVESAIKRIDTTA